MRFDEAYSGNVFLASTPDFEQAETVLFGMPMDWTVSFRPGARFGPKRVREVSLVLEEYSPYLDRDLSEIRYFDAGDIPLPFGNPEKSLQEISRFVAQIMDKKKRPIGIGGEHLVTWAVVREVQKHYPELAVIHLDAHADLRTDYEGEVYSHATPLHKIVQSVGADHVYQLGIRSGTKAEFQYARQQGIHFHPFEVLQPLQGILPQLKGRPVYLTVDIDVLDPAFAPGTGTPEPGGISATELLAAIHAIARSGVEVVGADLVEVAPVHDPTDQTPIVAAKVLREMLLGFSR